MSAILNFYRGTTSDTQGRLLTELWTWNDDVLEEVHDFIQWLFPLPEPSQYNPDAPLLTPDDIATFKRDEILRSNLCKSFDRILAFLGLSLAKDGKVGAGANFEGRVPDVWAFPNHNWLRVTRILRSLTLLGLADRAKALFDWLEKTYHSRRFPIGEDTMRYWEGAGRLQALNGFSFGGGSLEAAWGRSRCWPPALRWSSYATAPTAYRSKFSHHWELSLVTPHRRTSAPKRGYGKPKNLSTADVSPSTLLQRVLPQPRTALEAMYYAPGEGAQVLIGDGVNLRLKLRGADSGWIEPRSLARLDDEVAAVARPRHHGHAARADRLRPGWQADPYALRSRRSYRPGLSHNVAVQVITEASPGQFDPVLIGVFCR
jgi:Opioid growth factor receptor (OGFr) conserved region